MAAPSAYNAEKVSTSSDPHLVKGQSAYVLDERRRAALQEIDNQAVSWFIIRVGIVASVGFFTDAYDIFAINIAATMLGDVYGKGHALNTNQSLGVKVATPIGNIFGQAIFGYLADHVGRKRMYGIELMIMILATFGQAISGQGPAVTIVGALVCWRFLMGVGIGGDYPLSAVISSEFSGSRYRGRMMTLVFSAQGWGQFTAAIVGLVVTAAYKDSILKDSAVTLPHVDYLWRLIIGLGCVPGVIALYFRLTIPETPRYRMDIERNVKGAVTDIENMVREGAYIPDDEALVQKVDMPKASWADFKAHFGQWKNGKVLLGTAYSWFALDIAFYGLGLNNTIILQAIGFGSAPKGTTGTRAVYDVLKNACIGNLILSVAGLIPGFYASALLIDSWGRKPIQLMGFTMLTILFVVMGFGYDKLKATKSAQDAFVFLYCLTNFFQNFGPNTTTFVIPGEAFPTRYRSTAHGISAACGKLGAVISQVGFARLVNIHGTNAFLGHIMEILAFFMLTGIFSTLLIPETKLKTLEELSGEGQDGFVTGVIGADEVREGVVLPPPVGSSNAQNV